MILMGLDFETNGPDPEVCDITEAAWAIYDTEMGLFPVVSRSFLNGDVEEILPEAEKITGINVERCRKYGIPRNDIKHYLACAPYDFAVDYCVAHNAHGFDRVIYERLCPKMVDYVNWIDTMEDLPRETYERLGTRTLEFMAARSGFLNPFPHAALADVWTMMKVLFLEDIDVVVANSKIPTVTIAADVTFHEKDKAKERGYYWENIRGKTYKKKWVKRMKKDEVALEQEEAPFNVAIID